MLGVVTASEDGSYVYFVAEGRLTTQANSEQEEPVSGKPNLYLYHEGAVKFIATLAPATYNVLWSGGRRGCERLRMVGRLNTKTGLMMLVQDSTRCG